MNTINRRNLELGILYFIYLLFLMSAFFTTRSSLAPLYISNILVLSLLCVYIIAIGNNIKRWVQGVDIVYIILSIGVLLFTILTGNDIYPALLYLKIILLIIFVRSSDLKLEQFYLFLNRTFLIYLVFSISLYFNILPIANYTKWDHESMTVNIGNFHYSLLYGLEGSVAYLDSYSGLILLLNIFLNKGKYRKFYLYLSVVAVCWTLKMTPLVGLILAICSYYLVFRRKSAILLILSTSILFITLLYFLIDNINLYQTASLSFKEILYLGSHARTMIWEQQLMIMLNNYEWYNYLIGGFDPVKFSVPGAQLMGQETGTYYDNPHNTYLLLFYRSPLLFVLFYIALLKVIYKHFKREFFVLVFYILLVCYTNSSIISLQNPIYIMSLIFFIYKNIHANTMHTSRV